MSTLTYSSGVSMWGPGMPGDLSYTFDDWYASFSGDLTSGFKLGPISLDLGFARVGGKVEASAGLGYTAGFGFLAQIELRAGEVGVDYALRLDERLSSAAEALNADPFVDTARWQLGRTGLTSTGLDLANSFLSIDFLAELQAELALRVAAHASFSVGIGGFRTKTWKIGFDESFGAQLADFRLRQNLFYLSGDIEPLTLEYEYGRFTAGFPGPIALVSGPAAVGADTPLGQLRVEGRSDPFASATFNVASAIGALFGIPPQAFQDTESINAGPLSLGYDYTTLFAGLVGEAALKQSFQYTPSAVDVVMTSSLGQVLTGQLGDVFAFDTPEGEGTIDVTASYSVRGTLRTVTSIVLTSRLEFRIAELEAWGSLNLGGWDPSIGISLGPLAQGSVPIGGGLEIPLFTNVFALPLGTQTVTYSLAYENFRTGTEGADSLQLTTRQTVLDALGGNDSITGNALGNRLTGGAGGDTLLGLDEADTLDGGAGDDRLLGGSGDDTLLGGEAADTLLGEAGNDSLAGGAGDDLLDGGSGTAWLQGGDGNDTLVAIEGYSLVEGGEGDDRLVLGFGAGNARGGAGADRFVLLPRDPAATGNTSLSLEGLAAEDLLDLSVLGVPDADALRVLGAERGFVLHYDGSFVRVEADFAGLSVAEMMAAGRVAYGAAAVLRPATERRDDLFGTAAADTIAGGGDADRLFGGAGDDRLLGGSGDDTLLGGEAADTLLGEAGNDSLAGGAGDDLLDGGSGTAWLQGGDGNDTLVAIEGYSLVEGGEGDDRLVLGFGAGNARGGAGADRFVLLPRDPAATGNTSLSLEGLAAEDLLDLSVLGVPDADALRVLGAERGFVLHYDGSFVRVEADFAGLSVAEMMAAGRVAYGAAAVLRPATERRDDLFGTAAADTIAGGGDADRLFGGAGDDRLLGGSGDDTLLGSRGSDVIEGGAGTDMVVYGGRAADYLIRTTASGIRVSDLRAGRPDGVDTLLNVEAIRFADAILSGAGSEELVAVGAGGRLHVAGPSNSGLQVTFGPGGSATVFAGARAVAIVGDSLVTDLDAESLAAPILRMQGNAEANRLTGAASADRAAGEGGADTIFGAEGNDTLRGIDGDDLIAGGAGGDFLHGGAGADTASYAGSDAGVAVDLATGAAAGGHASQDTFGGFEHLHGSEHADTLGGNAAANSLWGGAGADVLSGAAGDDWLDGGAGADTLRGGTGHDTFLVDDPGDVVEESGPGRDRILSTIGWILPDLVEDLVLLGAEGLQGTGNILSNRIAGTIGADTLDGGPSGADTLLGGEGDDRYRVLRPGVVIVEAPGQGTDTLETTLSALTLAAGLSVERLVYAGASAIAATGNELDNLILGGAGADTLSGGTAGADTLAGGSGDDVYLVERLGILVEEAPGGGYDTLRTALANFMLQVPGVEALVYAGTVAFRGTGSGADEALTGGRDRDTLVGLAGADTLSGLGAPDLLEGGAGHDLLRGDGGNDRLFGDAGADTLQGGAGADLLDGGADADLLDGGEGDDQLRLAPQGDIALGGAGADRFVLAGRLPPEGQAFGVATVLDLGAEDLLDVAQLGIADRAVLAALVLPGGAGWHLQLRSGGLVTTWSFEASDLSLLPTERILFDTSLAARQLSGTAQADDLLGALGADLLDGGEGSDRLFGAAGSDSLAGGGGTDLLDGGADDDALDGGAGDDTLRGGAGADTLRGGAGFDSLEGGEGDDVLLPGVAARDAVGGAGTDRFVLADYIGAGQSSSLLIGDFQPDDLLDLREVGIADAPTLRALFGFGGLRTMTLWDAGHAIRIEIPALDPAALPAAGILFDTDPAPRTRLGSADHDVLLGGLGADTLEGNLGDDFLAGSAGDDLLDGGGGPDTLFGGAGADTLNGGEGQLDAVRYDGLSTEYRIEDLGGAYRVTDLRPASPDGVDLLHNVEILEFANGGVPVGYMVSSDAIGLPSGLLELRASTFVGVLTATLQPGGGVVVTADFAPVVPRGVTTGLIGIDASGTGAHTTTLTGNAAGNVLIGGRANDTLRGEGGDDILAGGRGNDRLAGGEGQDAARFSGNLDEYIVVNDGSTVTVRDLRPGSPDGEDLLAGIEYLTFADGSIVTPQPVGVTATGAGGALLLEGTTAEEVRAVLAASPGVSAPQVRQGAQLLTVGGTATGIQVVDATALVAPSVRLTGNGAANRLTGGGGDDWLSGGGGDDTLSGGDGSDVIDGGDGYDIAIFAGSRIDYLISRIGGLSVIDVREGGEGGADRLSRIELLRFADTDVAVTPATGAVEALAADGALVVAGDATAPIEVAMNGLATTVLMGGVPVPIEGNPDELAAVSAQALRGAGLHVTGDAASNFLFGSLQDDTLSGGGERDLLSGGAGNDLLLAGEGDDVLEGGGGADMLEGGAGRDLVSYRSASGGIVVDLAQPGANTGIAAGDSFVGVENVEGGAAADTLRGDDHANALDGLAGNDSLAGRAGDDTLVGGVGGDVLDGGAGADVASYEGAAEGVAASLPDGGGTGGDAAGDSFVSIEGLVGSSHVDTLVGDEGANRLTGGAGNDRLLGGAGGDSFIFLGPGDGTDEILDFTPGEDVILFSLAGFGISAPGDLVFDNSGAPPSASTQQMLLFDPASGRLSWDPDGSGHVVATSLAVLTGAHMLAASDLAFH
ncbi:calcium-binding protein [Falsiroseomonas oryzae]|uniref:calcium-binding protein n=1 Tax=Falsiroseomonas oryzae TaxID=2766473 RepID=UPI0022EA41F8|nr:hypothetical protein [Roseomonas sp. MO-31]